MLAKWIRSWYMTFLQPVVEFLARLGLTANMLTIASLIIITISGVLFAFGQVSSGLYMLVLGQIFDALDGPMARVSSSPSPFGEFIDSICDHYGDFAVYLGLLWLSLRNNAHTDAILLFVVMFGSLIGSQVRSRAGMVGINTKSVGLFTRFERTLILVAGIIFNQLTGALWLLAIFNNFSALQRVVYTVQASRSQAQKEAPVVSREHP